MPLTKLASFYKFARNPVTEIEKYYDEMVAAAHRMGIVPKAESAWEQVTGEALPYLRDNDLRGVHEVLRNRGKQANRDIQRYQTVNRYVSKPLEMGSIVSQESYPSQSFAGRLRAKVNRPIQRSLKEVADLKKERQYFLDQGMPENHEYIQKLNQDIEEKQYIFRDGPNGPFLHNVVFSDHSPSFSGFQTGTKNSVSRHLDDIDPQDIDEISHSHPFLENRAIYRYYNSLPKEKFRELTRFYLKDNEPLLKSDFKNPNNFYATIQNYARMEAPTPDKVTPSGKFDFDNWGVIEGDIKASHTRGTTGTWHQIYNPETGYQIAYKQGQTPDQYRAVYYQHRPMEQGLVPYVKELNLTPTQSKFKEFEAKVRELQKQSLVMDVGLTKLAWLYVA